MKKIITRLATAVLTPRLIILLTALFMLLSVTTMTAFMQEPRPAPVKPDGRFSLRDKRAPGPKSGPVIGGPGDGLPHVITGTTYQFTNAGGVALENMASGTTQINISDLDDGSSPSLSNIGFDFWYDGVRFTQFSVNANGFARLGALPDTGINIWENENFFASTSNAPKIAPFYDDLCLGNSGKIHFKIIGTAPNRKLVVEWLNMKITRDGGCDGSGAGTFQLWLFETTGVIEFVYGSGITGSQDGGYSVGLQSGADTNFASVSTAGPTVSYVTADNAQTDAITAGTKYTFTPLTPAAPSGLNFTAITATGMTLNWTDNSSNERGFVIYRSTDGVSYSFVTQVAAGTTSSAQSGLTIGTTYFWRVYAVTEGALSAALSGSQSTTAAPTITSNAVTGNWNATTTWVGGVVPTATDNVVIANGATVTINVTTATCLNLTVGQGTSGTLQYLAGTASTLTVNGSVTVAAGATFTAGSGSLATHNLRIGGSTAGATNVGSLTVNGTFDMNTTAGVTTTFFGTPDSTVTGTGATCDFFAITVNKGSSITPVIDVQRAITMNAPTGSNTRLTLTNGTFKLSSASTLAPYSNNQTICASSARLWLNHASASVTSNGVGTGANAGSPTISGRLQVDHGTFGYGSGNNTMTVSNGGSLFIGGADATVNMFGALQCNNNSTFNMTAGNLNVDAQAANNLGGTTDIVRFGSTAGGTVNVSFTGGTLTIVDPHAASGTGKAFSIFTNNPNTLNFVGSTIRFGNGVSTTAGSTDGFDIDTFAGNASIPIGNVMIDNTATNAATRFVRAGVFAPPLQIPVLGNVTLTGSGGSRFNLNSHLVVFAGNVINNGTIDGTTSGARFYWFGNGTAQTYSGTGTVVTPLLQMDMDNPLGLTIDPAVSSIVIASRLNLFKGTITNSNKLTIGNGGATQKDVQFGVAGGTTPGGNFDQAPAFNLGTGSYIVTYSEESVSRTTSFEIPSPSNTITSMDVSNPNGVTLGGNITVSGTLLLNAGNVTTNARTLAIGAGGTVTRTNGYVIGNLRKTCTANGPLTFEVGTANGYSPVAANVTAGTLPADFTVKATQGKQPNVTGTNALGRYWTLTATGVTADLTFNYLAADVVGTEANYQIFKYDGAFTGFVPTTLDTTNHVATLNGVSSFSDWTLAEPGAVQQALQFASETYSVSEGGGSVNVVVTRTGNGTGAVSASYTTGGGTANAGADYTTTSGTLNWADGDNSNRMINIPISDDSVYEGNETFNVTLSAPVGIIIGTPNPATVTINDNEPAPIFSIDNVTHLEGDSGTTAYVFTVTKTGSTPINATVDYATVNGTATAPSDFTAIGTTTLTFLPAETSKTVTVLVKGDTVLEPDETFTVHLSNPVSAVIANADGTGTITNDDVASVYVVGTTDDNNDGTCDGTHCSLREAITAANATGGQINFAPGLTGTITLLSPLPNLSNDININGPGSGVLTVRRSNAASNFRIFTVTATGTVTISGLTISNGNLNTFPGGGAVLNNNNATLNITGCVLSGNNSSLSGGAIYNLSSGAVNITGSTLSGNSTGSTGGAISNDVTGPITVTGSTISSNTAGQGGGIANNGTGALTIANSVITGNMVTTGAGGGVNNNSTGTVTVTGSTISNNSADSGAGIINNNMAVVTLTDSTISGNHANANGGGIDNDIGTINITRCTVSGNTVTNSAGNGGGIYNNRTGTINLTNSTVSGNSVGSVGGGGGVYFSSQAAGQGTIISSTITGNTARFGGGIDIENAGTSVTIKNTIIAGNTGTLFRPDIEGAVTSEGYNLIGNNDGTTVTPTTGDQIGTPGSPKNPLLGPLQNNGGPTFTHALLTGSPAIDAGNAFGLTTDQRGRTRPHDIVGVANVSDGTDIGAFEVIVCASITVNPSSLPDSALNVTYTQTLNATGGTAPYTFAVTSGSLPAGLTLFAGGALTGMPTASGTFNLTITATDANGCTGNRAYTINVCPIITVSPTSLPDGTLGVFYNQTISASGGTAPYTFAVTGGNLPNGLSLAMDGALTGTPTVLGLFNFTVTAMAANGCIGSRAYTVTINCPTITINPATLPNGDLGAAYTTNLTATGGAAPYTLAVTAGAVPTGLTLNAAGTWSGTATAAGTFNFTVTATDANACTATQAYTLTINYAHDYTVNSLGDTGAGSGTMGDLRYCITQVNAAGGTNTIGFSVSGTITLSSALPAITQTVVMTGPGAGLLTISGNDSVRVFQVGVNNPGAVTFSNLTIANGKAVGSFGGGVYHQGSGTVHITGCVIRNCSALIGGGIFNEFIGTIDITGSTVRNNSATGGGGSGGGAFNYVGGTINVTDSTFNNNSAEGGGGIKNNDNAASGINLTNSTFSGNSAAFGGGFLTAGGITTITNCTFTNNTATGQGGGLWNSTATCNIKNSIIAQNASAAGPDLYGTYASQGYNLIGTNQDATGFSTSPTPTVPNPNNDYVGTTGALISPQLAPLGNYGGATQTHALAADSLAIDHGSAVAGLTADQRGSTRPFDDPNVAPLTGGNDSDIGAFELQAACSGFALSPTSLPNGNTSSAYNQTVTTGSGSTTYTIAAGALPTGLMLNASSGLISGTPTATGNFTFTILATETSGCLAIRSYSVNIVACATITISPASLPGNLFGTPYSQSLTASGGTMPYTFAVTLGSLPAGLMLSSDGALTGTSTVSGTFNFTITATDANGCTGTQAYTLLVCPVITVNPASLPPGVTGTAYTQTITATGGAVPYSFTVTAGAVPTGLTLNPDGTWTGTPTAAGSFNFTVSATDANSCTATQPYTLTINCPTLTVNPSSLSDGLVGALYPQALTATGGSSPYTFAVTTGALPAGLTLNPDGTWSGTPTMIANASFTVTATDSNHCTGSRAYTLSIGNTCTWNGSESEDWHTPANWTPAFVPSTPNDVIIPASGTSSEALLSSAAGTVHNLTVAARRLLTLQGFDLTVNGTLKLSGGLIDAGANTLILGPAATLSRSDGQVLGQLRKLFSDPASFTYPVGTTNGYSPVDVAVTAGSGELTIKAVQGPQPVVDASQSLRRYWALEGSGITVNLVFHYLDPTDIPAGGSDAGYRIIRVSGGTAAIFPNDCATGWPCVDAAANTGTINGVSSFSDWTMGAPAQPTAVKLERMEAKRYENGTMIEWETGFEADNLGFNLYREVAGRRALVNREILAGSALVTGRAALLAGRRYACWDALADKNGEASYYIEDVDLNGKANVYGPIRPQRINGKPPALSQADVLSRLGQSEARQKPVLPGEGEGKAVKAGTAVTQAAQVELAGKTALKLSVRQPGWYRVTQPEMAAAGLNVTGDPRRLQLWVDGIEQPMLVIGESDGRLDASDAVEFYGVGLDTPETDVHVYWLVAGEQAGKRITFSASKAKGGGATSFAYTTERRDRGIYFSSLRNGEAENFFGAVVSGQGTDQTMLIQHPEMKAAGPATLEVALQGVTDLPASPDHLVNVMLNGVTVGALSFDGQQHKVETMTINAGLLREGANTVRLVAAGGSGDVSLVDYVRLTYAHSYMADADELVCTTSGSGSGTVAQTIGGFTTALIRVLDITDPQAPEELAGQIEPAGEGYAVTVAVAAGTRTLMAFTDAEVKPPAALRLNQASSLRQAGNGADLLMITRRDAFAALAPLVAWRQSQGLSVALIDVEDIYDEFSYGNKTAAALKELITYAKTTWKKKPRYVLLGGDASYDGRNYLGYGDIDSVPTKQVDTALMETASDEWLADEDGDGIGELAVGRLPYGNAAEAAVMVAKILGYEQGSASEEVMLVADAGEGYDFERANAELQALVPSRLRVSQVNRGRLEAEAAKRQLIDGIHRKQLFVNYAGHGSVNLWRGGLLTSADGAGLSNEHLPVFVMMTCLNGYFDDPGLDGLGEALLKAERGGAVAVWGSSGMTVPGGQAAVNKELYRIVFGGEGVTMRLGEAVRRAKAATIDGDVRRTWLLLGDPTMRLK